MTAPRTYLDHRAYLDHRTYLDHNATTPLHPDARAAMAAAFDVFGNPSSIHAEGRRARVVLEEARRAVAGLTGVAPDGVIFTSGATEALNIVLTPDLTRDGVAFDHLLVGGGEHPAVLAGHRFGDRIDIVPLRADGQLDLDALDTTLDRLADRRVMMALQVANNETGVVQPVAAAAERIHARGGYMVCDAVQAAGKMACDINTFGADALAISAHKFGGPKGVGALCFASSRHHLGHGVVRGGGQERGVRAGTENLIGIAGMGAACVSAAERAGSASGRIGAWRSALEDLLVERAPEVVVFGRSAPRLPNTTCFAVAGYDSQLLLMNLDLNGVAVSAGSACSSGKVKASHVLAAMNVAPELAASALRVSLGWTTRQSDITRFAAAFTAALETMKPRVAA